jgi:uncharacterized membrane protein
VADAGIREANDNTVTVVTNSNHNIHRGILVTIVTVVMTKSRSTVAGNVGTWLHSKVSSSLVLRYVISVNTAGLCHFFLSGVLRERGRGFK